MKHIRTSIIGPVVRCLGATAASLFLASHAVAADGVVYTQDFDADSTANWVVNVTTDGYNIADFYFDYSTVGIPSAPHSTGGTTRGLKLAANLGAGGVFPSGISVSPLNFGIAENFDMRFDMWLNFNKSGVGSTEVGGAGYGTAGVAAQVAGVADSVHIGATTDGGSSADYRVYAPNYAVSYQDTARVDPNDPTSPLVYAAGSRNNTANYYVTNFPGQPCPEAQTNLFPRQTGLAAGDGTLAFKWHDVSLKKVGKIISYRVDGVLIATVNSDDAGNLGGTNILFNMYDINAGGSTDVDSTNILFALFDNVRITAFTNVVNVYASVPDASEDGPSPGTFTITRNNADGPLTVYYTVGGTATSGSDFQPLSGSATFGAFDTTVDVTVTPVDDSESEFSETVILTLQDGTNYNGAGSAIVRIADNDTPTLNIKAIQPSMYEGLTNDFMRFRLERYGKLNAPDFNVNVAYSGTASGSDYVAPTSVIVPSGASTTDFTVTPVNNTAVTGPRTVIATLQAGAGYALGGTNSATGTIVDDDNQTATILFQDPLTDPGDASNWAITYGTGDLVNDAANYNVDFGFDLASMMIPPPPGGAATALRITCNKNNPGAPGAVNVYYTNQAFSGNYAVRFNLNLVEGSQVNIATEAVLFGINHSGSYSNWVYGSGTLTNANFSSDGIWYLMFCQAGGASSGDYHEYTGIGGTNGNTGWQRVATRTYAGLTNDFKSNPGPYTAISGTDSLLGGIPANATPFTLEGASWADVEIKQLGKVVTMSINKVVLFSYTNSTVWTNGYLMLGYADPFGASVGSADAAAYFANLKVVSLDAPSVTGTVTSGNNVTITFTAKDGGDPATAFAVEGAATVNGPYTQVTPVSSVTSLGDGVFQVTVPQNGSIRFYRVRNK